MAHKSGGNGPNLILRGQKWQATLQQLTGWNMCFSQYCIHFIRSLGVVCLLMLTCPLAIVIPTALAWDTTTVPLRDWHDYTEREREILQERWSEEDVESVVKALTDGSPMPEFVQELAPLANGPGAISYDLRGIPLAERDLPRIQLEMQYLQGADLNSSDLTSGLFLASDMQGAKFYNANLLGATLAWADLRRCKMQFANLVDATVDGSDLRHARLQRAEMQRVDLRQSDLHDADLTGVDLKGAVLQEAKLQNTDLMVTIFDSTHLFQVDLGAAKNLRYIKWGTSESPSYITGEEKRLNTREDYRRAEITYRDLKAIYKQELLPEIAAEFHYRENEVRTNRYLRTIKHPMNYLWGSFRTVFLKWTYGYSSRPSRLFWFSVAVVFFFGCLYAILTRLRWRDSGICFAQSLRDGRDPALFVAGDHLIRRCMYFSLLSFATFGYGAIKPKQWLQLFQVKPKDYEPVRWARVFVGIEAALGIWVFALLVTVLFGK
jgi:uncharacterized protein YjbI with pentapeptide repeats